MVDQTTEEAIKLRSNSGKIGIDDLAISTLRGQFADNREWSADPSRPAIICGTVDMIGSRLLFSGYGCGFKTKPLHAGFLGQDVFLVHDEAHLEPAFQELIESIKKEQHENEHSENIPWPKLYVMALSATARNGNINASHPFELTEDEKKTPDIVPDPPTKPIHHVWLRLKAKKQLEFHSIEDKKDAVAKKIGELAFNYKDKNCRMLIFVRTIKEINIVVKELEKTKRQVVRLTGTMRGKERDELVKNNDVFKQFLMNSESGPTVYLVCTSAGEVGIDISADHMVCDLTPFDSMAQRFGRVNRYGKGGAFIEVVYPESFDEKDTLTPAREKTLELLKSLNGDASPLALMKLDANERANAFTPTPTILPATDILFDAWALTTIRERMPGRPPVEPYLHGIREWEPAETYVAWRDEVEKITGELLYRYKPEDLLEDYPLKPHELLRDRSDRVFKQLEKLAKRHSNEPMWLLGNRGTVEPQKLGELVDSLGQMKAKDREDRLNGYTILLPRSVGGLKEGMLDGTSEQANDVADDWLGEDNQRRRERLFSNERQPDGPLNMALIRTIDTKPDADELESLETEGEYEEEEGVSTKRGRFWHWYVQPRNAENATRASIRPVTWDDHTQDVVDGMTRIINRLNFPDNLNQALILAAEMHDLGKKREQWQRSIGNPNPNEWYAKPGKPFDGPRWQPRYLSPYRHEFGSLLDIIDQNGQHADKFNSLSADMQDLVLHLIAAHHGRARPHFQLGEVFDPERPSSETKELTIEIPRRFARLQRKYGRWGLAYLESFLRAADWSASSNPSERTEVREEVTT